MEWIKRNWLRILLYLVFSFFLWFIQPAQEQFYLDDEIQSAHKLSNRFNLISVSVLVVLGIIYLLVKKIPRMSSWGAGANAAVLCLGLFSTPAIESTILYANRKFPKGEYQHKYIVDSMGGDTTHMFLSDPVKKKFLFFETQKLVSAEKLDRLHFGDIVIVTFYHGLFGVDYPCSSCSN